MDLKQQEKDLAIWNFGTIASEYEENLYVPIDKIGKPINSVNWIFDNERSYCKYEKICIKYKNK